MTYCHIISKQHWLEPEEWLAVVCYRKHPSRRSVAASSGHAKPQQARTCSAGLDSTYYHPHPRPLNPTALNQVHLPYWDWEICQVAAFVLPDQDAERMAPKMFSFRLAAAFTTLSLRRRAGFLVVVWLLSRPACMKSGPLCVGSPQLRGCHRVHDNKHKLDSSRSDGFCGVVGWPKRQIAWLSYPF